MPSLVSALDGAGTTTVALPLAAPALVVGRGTEPSIDMC
jgi:hypothetical protein